MVRVLLPGSAAPNEIGKKDVRDLAHERNLAGFENQREKMPGLRLLRKGLPLTGHFLGGPECDPRIKNLPDADKTRGGLHYFTCSW